MGPQSKHVTRTRAVTATLAFSAAVLTGVGCDDTVSDAGEKSFSPSDATAAKAVCEALRAWENRLIDVANTSAAHATDADDATTRSASLLDGFAGLAAEAHTLTDAVLALRLPDDDRWRSLRADLLEGPREAETELRDERRILASQGPTSQADERGRVGQFFNSLEKVFSVVEPTLGQYADESMQTAFASESSCAHVVQT